MANLLQDISKKRWESMPMKQGKQSQSCKPCKLVEKKVVKL